MRAITRRIPARFADALCAAPPDPPIELATARAQHDAYRAALASCGVEVIDLPADDARPDSCFVEDTAVVADGVALITRPGAPSRQPEVDAVAAALAPFVEIVRMAAPATLDGGDVLRVGRTFYVGRSARTSAAGVERLREVFAPRGYQVVAVPLPADVLHLKCVCARLDDERVLVADGPLPAGTFAAHTVTIPAAETYAANVLTIGDHALCADGFPRTRDLLESSGFRTLPLATTEVRKADGALTCLSILI